MANWLAFATLVTLVLVVQVSAKCDHRPRDKLKAQYDVVVFGKEVTITDYLRGIGAIVTDFNGGWGIASLGFVDKFIKDHAAGKKELEKIIKHGGEVDMGHGKLRSGVLTYHCGAWTYTCCFKRWKFVCGKRCGKIRFWPDYFQHYIAYKKH